MNSSQSEYEQLFYNDGYQLGKEAGIEIAEFRLEEGLFHLFQSE